MLRYPRDRAFIARAIDEDLGHGDLTTDATIDPGSTGTGDLLAKSDLVVSGLPIVQDVFDEVGRRLDASVRVTPSHAEGAAVTAGTIIGEVTGDLRTIVIGERVALNLLMKLCGIATNTRRFVEAAGNAGLTVVDTRKTTPGLRALEKYAVRCGGAKNHRHALFDGVMVKDNHITAVGSLTEAVRRARAAVHHLVRIEVEVASLAELDEALDTDADVILLDNMDNDTLAKAVQKARAARTVLLEASGNMTPERIASLRDHGLDFVSAGGLIHQATWADLSLKLRR
ncbi:MAG: carboxylating nicotinate-nucleotide diphosphorylase [Myxococcota bacterium]